MSGKNGKHRRMPGNVMLELEEEGQKRLEQALEGMREFNAALTLEGLVVCLFLYGLERVELELEVARNMRDQAGGTVPLTVVRS